MLDFRLLRSVGRPHRNLSPWIGGGLLAIGGLGAIIAVALTPVRPVPAEARVTAPLPLHVVAVEAPAAVAPAAAEPPAPDCYIPQEEEADVSNWTIGPHHVGPLVACAPLTTKWLLELPSYFSVTFQAFEEPSDPYTVLSLASGERVVRFWKGEDPGDFAVKILSRRIATPWGVRVGDRVRDLRAHHPDIECRLMGADGDFYVACERAHDDDGWRDPLRYELRWRDVPRRVIEEQKRSAEDAPIDLARIANARIESIDWSNQIDE